MQILTKKLWLGIGILSFAAGMLVSQDMVGGRQGNLELTTGADGLIQLTSFPLAPNIFDESDTWRFPDIDSPPNAAPSDMNARPEPAPYQKDPAVSTKAQGGIHWGSFMRQWWLDISVEQAERVTMEAKTRDQLRGKFFQEWFSDVAKYRYGLWNDGDRFFTSYLGHPLQGAVIEDLFWQNDDRVRFSSQDFHSSAYRKALLQAFAFAALDAVQWKLGPISEASIGHVGLPPHWWDEPHYCNLAHVYCHPRTGLNDLVMNEAGGTVLIIGFQWIDKHIDVLIEKRFNNRALIDTTRILTNPPQSLANLLRFRRPWFRDDRDGVATHTP